MNSWNSNKVITIALVTIAAVVVLAMIFQNYLNISESVISFLENSVVMPILGALLMAWRSENKIEINTVETKEKLP